LESIPREILLYETDDGSVPFSDWMDSIEGQPIYDIVMVRLDRVEKGSFGDHRPVGEGVSELRIDFGKGYRVYFGRIGNDIVVLLVGGEKSSQAEDIKLAKKYWRKCNARESL
jgi:putative addiction module killer protein